MVANIPHIQLMFLMISHEKHYNNQMDLVLQLPVLRHSQVNLGSKGQ